MENELVAIGKIVVQHGVDGAIILQHVLGRKADFKGVKALFIEEKKGSYIPYFITASSAKKADESLLQLEGISSREQATRFVRKQVWVQEEDFNFLVARDAPIALIHYDVVEGDKILGQVTEVVEQPHQVICIIHIDEKEVMIPLNDSTLEKIDRNKKTIHVNLPDGLIDLYLGNEE